MPEQSNVTKVIGVDVFIIQEKIPSVPKTIGPFQLYSISNRGALVWPVEELSLEMCDHVQCRYMADANSKITQSDLVELLKKLTEEGFQFSQVERLIELRGKKMFSESRSE